MPKSVLLIGGPSTGKTTLLTALEEEGYPCLEEVSRQVTRKAREQGIDQLFLEEPLRFSELLLEARIAQYESIADFNASFVFLDRGIPDTVAYMDYVDQSYTAAFTEACTSYRYDYVFVLPLWKAIHTTDAERYESFEQALDIQKALLETYERYGYEPIEVPVGPVHKRMQFILEYLGT